VPCNRKRAAHAIVKLRLRLRVARVLGRLQRQLKKAQAVRGGAASLCGARLQRAHRDQVARRLRERRGVAAAERERAALLVALARRVVVAARKLALAQVAQAVQLARRRARGARERERARKEHHRAARLPRLRVALACGVQAGEQLVAVARALRRLARHERLRNAAQHRQLLGLLAGREPSVR
jgi:hypothetical protein